MLAEGSWLAVVYAALQAVAGGVPWLGPLEMAALAWAGMAWGRRRRWRGAATEALGLPLLAFAAGAFAWLLDPAVRAELVQGHLAAALSLHGPGWLAAIAFWRGELHRSRDDDDAIQDQLLRWAVPGLALPWVVGHLASSGRVEDDFTAAAFVGTIFFIGSAFTAMGLARLEAVRTSTGSDWRANRSWLVLVVGIALVLTLISIPAAAFLGVPLRSLMAALFGPLQTVLFLLVLLVTPLIVLAALAADVIVPLLPEGFGLGEIRLPSLVGNVREVTSNAPTVLFYLVIGALVLMELVVLVTMLWMRWQEKSRMRAISADPFEERSIVIPQTEPAPLPAPGRTGQRRGRGPTAAYLDALDALARDGRWPRRPDESPAAHLARARADGLVLPAFARLAAAYQLLRYGARPLGDHELRRNPRRLQALRAWLRR
jgi:hypothetical protein